MFAHRFCTRSAGAAWRLVLSGHYGAAIAVAALAVLLAACSQAPQRLAGGDPSDPHAPVPRVTYRSAIGSYASQRPAEPLPWRDQNDRIAPTTRP